MEFYLCDFQIFKVLKRFYVQTTLDLLSSLVSTYLVTIPNFNYLLLRLNNILGFLHYILNVISYALYFYVEYLRYWILNCFDSICVWGFWRKNSRVLSLFIQIMVHFINIVKHNSWYMWILFIIPLMVLSWNLDESSWNPSLLVFSLSSIVFTCLIKKWL